MSRDFPTKFVAVAALCFLSSTDWVGGIRVAIQDWIFDLIGSAEDSGSFAGTIIPKLPHVALFGLLGYIAGSERRNGLRWRLFGASIAVAVTAELLQIYTDTREFAAGDLAVNVLSVAALFWVAARSRTRPQPSTNP